MARIAFYELPDDGLWSGLAVLASVLMDHGKMTIVVDSEQDAAQLSTSLWALAPSVLVPHGIQGVDADDDVDPVVIAVGRPRMTRSIVMRASMKDTDAWVAGEFTVDIVPRDAELKRLSRERFRACKERGLQPEFLAWDAWSPRLRGESP